MNTDWQEYFNTCDEPSLWYIIDGFGGLIFYTEHDLADGRMESTPGIEQWLEKAKKQIEQAVDKTARFGIDNPRTEDGVPTAAYWDWYRCWKTKWDNSDEDERQSWELKVKGSLTQCQTIS